MTNVNIETTYYFINECEKSKVLTFIQNNKFLIPILKEACKRIKLFFGDTQNYLIILEEPDDKNFKELFIVIKSKKKLRIAMKSLDALFNNWFVNIAPQVAGFLDITFESVEDPLTNEKNCI